MKKTVIPKRTGMTVFFMLSDQEDIAGYIQGEDTWHLWRAAYRVLRSHR